uniref:Uncharacterized protein n=1 Tax=Rhizophora mucronata TaxID=61149 RepID=A0A2P2J334_RHIMU
MSLHTSRERVVNITLHLFSLSGRGIPIFRRSIPSQTSSNKRTNFFLFITLYIFHARCSWFSGSSKDNPSLAAMFCWILSATTSFETTTHITVS